jgi:hypothetical protein
VETTQTGFMGAPGAGHGLFYKLVPRGVVDDGQYEQEDDAPNHVPPQLSHKARATLG